MILAGDSAGGNIILALPLEALREDQEETKEVSDALPGTSNPHPVALMAISPSTDLRRTNPAIKTVEPYDPILTITFIESTARAWAGNWDPCDPKISPLRADVSLLAMARIKVHGVTGRYDILAPDAMLFRDKCGREGVSGQWLDWDKQMHCFLLAWPYGVPEGREAVGWMVDVLRKE